MPWRKGDTARPHDPLVADDAKITKALVPGAYYLVVTGKEGGAEIWGGFLADDEMIPLLRKPAAEVGFGDTITIKIPGHAEILLHEEEPVEEEAEA